MRPKVFSAFILIFWAGFVSSISFMESWLKFQAPGIDLPLGLGIGKLIFSNLNIMEWVFLFLFAVIRFCEVRRLRHLFNYVLAIIVASLAIQTFFLLPELNERADLIIRGTNPPRSSVHLLYGMTEVIKVILLIFAAWFQIYRSPSGRPLLQSSVKNSGSCG